MLFVEHFLERAPALHRQFRKPVVIFVFDAVGTVFDRLIIERQKPIEFHDGTVRAKHAAIRGNVNSRRIEERVGHLRREKPLPDELVKAILVFRKIILKLVGRKIQ